jgi:hypothetical protein
VSARDRRGATELARPRGRAPSETRCSEDAVIGRLCVTQRDNGYDATYQNQVCDCVDFNLQTSDTP